MVKGLIVAAVVFIASAFAAGNFAHAQTTNTTNTTVTPTAATTNSTTNSTTKSTVPSGAPDTGRAQ